MNQGSEIPVKYAGFWIRLVASTIDGILLTMISGIVQLLVMAMFFWIQRWIRPAGGDEQISFVDSFNPMFIQLLFYGVYSCVAFPYYVWGHFRYGTTLGKKPFGIYVVSAADQGRLTLSQSIIRTAGYVLSSLPFACGYLMAAFHPRKQALHDLIAGTVSRYRHT